MSYFVGHKETRRYLHDTAVFLKKDDFNKPSASPFFQKENGGLNLLFQNRHFRSTTVLLPTSGD